jgi:hypothetical protein
VKNAANTLRGLRSKTSSQAPSNVNVAVGVAVAVAVAVGVGVVVQFRAAKIVAIISPWAFWSWERPSSPAGETVTVSQHRTD